MPCSSQPNREFARAPTRIFVWRQFLRVGVRADGADPHGKRESPGGLVAGLTADEFLLRGEVVDEWRCHDAAGRTAGNKRLPDPRRPRYRSTISAVPIRDIQQCSSE